MTSGTTRGMAATVCAGWFMPLPGFMKGFGVVKGC